MAKTTTVPTWTPPRWMNRLISVLLMTPGLQSWLGRQPALITFTGHRSGRRFKVPVTYYRDGDTVVIITKQVRNWWLNFPAPVTLQIAGRTITGHADAVTDEEAKLPLVAEFLRNRPRDAKAYGVTLDADGKIDPNAARALVPIRVHLD